MAEVPISLRVPIEEQTTSERYFGMLSGIRSGFPEGAKVAREFACANNLQAGEVDAALRVGVPVGYKQILRAISDGNVGLEASARDYAEEYNPLGYGLSLDELDTAVEEGRTKASGLEMANVGLRGVGSMVG